MALTLLSLRERITGIPRQSALGTQHLAGLIDGYSLRIYPAVLDQQTGAVVCSALGVWLLLAACAAEADGEDRRALEDALGCNSTGALELLSAVIASPPPALKAAIALWVSVADATEPLAAWARTLPHQVESGYMPTKKEADAWVKRNTLGLISSFPLEIDGLTRIVLASVLATKVSWEAPFDVAHASDHLGSASPWRGAVSRLLWDRSPQAATMIARTSAAGVVAAHAAVAAEDLTVLSVSAAPDVAREAVLDAAHELGALVSGRTSAAARVSLYDLTLGPGHSWEIEEHRVPSRRPDERLERIADAVLPAWRNEGSLELLQSAAFATEPALRVLRRLIGPRPSDRYEARQVAVASYTRYGFEAAAVTAFSIAAAGIAPRATAVERSARLRFDHPYAVLALAGKLGSGGGVSRGGSGGLPLFTAWVQTPEEPEDAPASARR